jgi:uncharacterized membrane protein
VTVSSKRFLLATLAGGVTAFVTGFLIYGVATDSFFRANPGSAVGTMKDVPDFVYLSLGQLMFGLFLTVLLGKWIGATTAGTGLQVGAVAGLLMGLAVDLTNLGVLNVMNLTATLVDPLLWAVQLGLSGAAVGAVLGRVK